MSASPEGSAQSWPGIEAPPGLAASTAHFRDPPLDAPLDPALAEGALMDRAPIEDAELDRLSGADRLRPPLTVALRTGPFGAALLGALP